MSYNELTLKDLLSEFSKGTPTPGGGSAAALSSSVSASLISMVARITAKGKKYADRAEEMQEIACESEGLGSKLQQLITLDSSAYDGVSSAFRLPKTTDDEKQARREAIQLAMKHAADIPLLTMKASLSLLKLSEKLVALGNPNCITDTLTSSFMALTGLKAASLNVEINLESIKDTTYSQVIRQELLAMHSEAMDINKNILAMNTKKD